MYQAAPPAAWSATMTLKASCHCGRTRMEIDLDPSSLTRCTCSFCSKRGALWIYAVPDQFRLLTARGDVADYVWGGRTGVHHHCAFCGCGTFSEFPSFLENGEPDHGNPRVAVNAHLLDDLDIHALPVEVIDGRTLW
jgi:hypothetical protein